MIASVVGVSAAISPIDFGTTGTATLILTVNEGLLDVTLGASNLVLSTGTLTNTSTITLTGTMSEIDSFLRGDGGGTIEYTSTTTINDTFTVSVSDGGNTGGAAETGTNVVTITKDAGNTAPDIASLDGETLTYGDQLSDGAQIIDQSLDGR